MVKRDRFPPLNLFSEFNGGTELEEDYGVNLYSTFYRRYDPQIGRFSGVDALSEENFEQNPYEFAYNDPIYYNDPSGLLADAEHPIVLDEVIINLVSPGNRFNQFEWNNLLDEFSQNNNLGGGGNFGSETSESSHIRGGGGSSSTGTGPGDKTKKVEKKKPSKAKSIIKKTLKIAGTTILVLGGPEDVVGDGAAVTEVVVGAVIAGVVYLFENVDGNSSFPGPWSYTVRPSSEDPINYPQGFKNDEYPPNSGGPPGWISAGVALYDIYKTFREKMSDFFTRTMPVHNP